MTTNATLQEYCLTRLNEEGLEAFAEPDSDFPEETVLRVPALECERHNGLSYKAVMAFIHGKLQGNPLKGLRGKHPVSGVDYDIYCYDPDVDGRELVASDVCVWSIYSNKDTFDWTELASDDSGWSDGWFFYDSEHLEQRLVYLASVLSYQLFDLPAPAPLTLEELCSLAKNPRDKRGVYCRPPKGTNKPWWLRLGTAGELVLHKCNGDTAVITAENFDAKGRLVIDGRVGLTRAMMD